MFSIDSSNIYEREIDVGILTIVPVEIYALFSTLHINPSSYEFVGSPLRYWRTTYKSIISKRNISIVLTFISDDSGNTIAATTTTQFLRDWYPKLMCLVGISAAIHGKARLGDVLIPSKIHDRTIKVFESGIYKVRGLTYSRSEILNRQIKLLAPKQKQFEDAVNEFCLDELELSRKICETKGIGEEDFNCIPRMLNGSIASDNVLIRDSAYFKGIADITDEKCRGGEMEAAGFACACLKDRENFPWLIFRGISDFGDSSKSDEFQLLAAKNACTALKLYLEQTINIDLLPENPRAVRSAYTFEKILISFIKSAFDNRRYQEVCRLGRALSRPLHLSGRLKLRYEIGCLVEKAAAYSNNNNLRSRTLIDDVGWTLMSLGFRDEGYLNICDGIRLAEHIFDYYLIAKGCRHLASIERDEGNIIEAEKLLEKASENAERIDSEIIKDEMLSALCISFGKIKAKQDKHQEAIVFFKDALDRFEKCRDMERGIKVYYQLAKSCIKLNKISEAKEYYITGRSTAKNLGRFDEYRRNTIGLIELYKAENDINKVKALSKELLELANSYGFWSEVRELESLLLPYFTEGS